MARLVFSLLFAFLAFSAPSFAKEKIPSGRDGYRESAVFNGYQNMPVVLYGIAADWNLACLKKKAEACVQLAEAFEEGLGDLIQDQRIALGYYKEGCEAGSAKACAKAAQMINAGTANFKKPALAAELGARGCAQKNLDACAAQAEGMMTGSDYEGGLTLARTTCNAKVQDACRLVARHEFDRVQNYGAAIALAQNGCDAKQAWGCNIMVEAYQNGKGVERDRAKVFDYAERGCTVSEGERIPACREYGIMLVNDRPDKASWEKGADFLNLTCIALEKVACREIGKLGLRGGATTTVGEGIFYLRRACDLEDAQGCALLAGVYDTGREKVVADAGVAYQLLQRACKLNSVHCGRAKTYGDNHSWVRDIYWPINPSEPVALQLVKATEQISGNNKNEALMAVVRLMHEQNEYAEWLLGGWMYYGLPGVFDVPRKSDGVILIENAARVGHEDALIWIGMAYWYGNDVPLDRKKGEEYMLIAAQRGSEKAAAIYRSMLLEPWREEQARRSKEFEEAQKRMAEEAKYDWTRSWGSYTNYYSNSSGSTYQSSNSVSSIMDNHNWNNAMNYYSGYTSACSSSNPYC